MLIPVIRLSIATQKAIKQTPTFQDSNIFPDNERRASMHDIKFAIGTSGYVGSILSKCLTFKTHPTQ